MNKSRTREEQDEEGEEQEDRMRRGEEQERRHSPLSVDQQSVTLAARPPSVLC